ncbi:hypothetical protein AWB98_01160 [Mycolicibacterium conceptionense]|uniref:Serine recombinase n=2 Tax=Mycolicibacterium conceptionense TaxID=451644 RepID=A0ABX3UZH0_9MYCO|nr:recombinase family protein [Mycolicibacterium conceptionense]ORV20937.1 hypothetical protein AWB98_01160 [Mycolicibacterium conceptionense]
MRAAIYARISADIDGNSVGVDRQMAACQALAKKAKHRVTETFTDNDISAYSGKVRPGFEKLLAAMARSEFDVLIVWHVDRLYRSMKDLERIIDAAESGAVQIQTVESGNIDLTTSAGKMVARILGSVARQESEHHAERRRIANKDRALEGEWRREGSRPFGYLNDGTPLEPEASMIRLAATEILGGKSLHAVAREWNDSGVTTVRGARWTNLHVRRVLTNARVAGLRVHRGEIVGTGKWESLIPETTWRGLVAFLSSPERKNAVSFERRYLLSGVARCGVCKKPLYAAYPHGRDRAMIYVCKSGSHVGRNGADLDEFIERTVVAYLGGEGVGRDLRNAENNVDIAELREKRDALVATKDQLATLLRKGILDMAAVERESAVLTADIEAVNRQMADAVEIHPVAALLAADGEEPGDLDGAKLIERWKAATPDRKGKIIKALLLIEVNPTKRGGRVFDPDSVDVEWVDYSPKAAVSAG